MAMLTRRLLAGLVLLAGGAGACASHAARRTTLAPARPPDVTVALVDSVAWEEGGTAGVLRRIRVHTGTGVDTIAGILTSSPPVSVAGAVLGFEAMGGTIVHAFRYDLTTRHLSRLPLPRDFSAWFSAPAISPTGEYLAYVVVPGNSTAAGVVCRWPAGPEVARSAFVRVPPTDEAVEHARWLDAQRFEIYIDLTTGAERWHRIRGDVATGALSADTVLALP